MSSLPISAVITLYNKRNYVRRAVESILSQRQPAFEVIVVDDGSTDGGAATLQSLVDRRFVRIVRQVNGGEGAARNRGIHEAKGTLIAMLDADDEWDPDFLAAITELARLYPEAGLYATGYRSVFDGGFVTETTFAANAGQQKLLVPDYFQQAAHAQFVWISAQAVRSDVYEAVDGYLERAFGCDLDMLGRIALRFQIAYDCRVLATYRNEATGRMVPDRRKDPGAPPFVATARKELARLGTSRPKGLEAYVDVLLARHAYQLAAGGHRERLIELIDSNMPFRTTFDRALLRWCCASRLLWLPVLWQRVRNSRWMFDRFAANSNGAITRRADGR